MQLPSLDLPDGISEQKLLVIAREVAMDIFDIDQILQFTNTSPDEYARIKEMPRFQNYLQDQLGVWNGALNTHERVKIKAAMQVEYALPELYNRLHDASENLMAKVKVAELIAKLAGMGVQNANINGETSDRFTVTINLGNDQKLQISENITHKVIEGEVLEDDMGGGV